MCTSICYRNGGHFFGRTLDVEFSFREQVVVTPRGYHFPLKNGTDYYNRYALIGMASVMGDRPLYYEAANEVGLAAAGLNFPGNAVYHDPVEGKDNIALFEFLPWTLGQAGSVAEVRELLSRLNLTNLPFSPDMPTSPLHFMFSDREESIVVEPMADGLHIYEDPYDVMTNNPPFSFHLWNLRRYLNLDPQNRKSTFSPRYDLPDYGVGMGAQGLPGDASSDSRFVRAAFHLANSYRTEGTGVEAVTQFFHVLDSVRMLKGSTLTANGKNDITLYTCCMDLDQGIYYYKTYDNSQLTAVRLRAADLDGKELVRWDLRRDQQIQYEN